MKKRDGRKQKGGPNSGRSSGERGKGEMKSETKPKITEKGQE